MLPNVKGFGDQNYTGAGGTLKAAFCPFFVSGCRERGYNKLRNTLADNTRPNNKEK